MSRNNMQQGQQSIGLAYSALIFGGDGVDGGDGDGRMVVMVVMVGWW